MLQIKNTREKEPMIHRLARVEGQLRGVQKMIADDRDCREVFQQLIAIRAAVQSASLSYLQSVVSECLLNMDYQDDLDAQKATMTDLIKMLGKLSE